MQELRFIGVHEDGGHVLLADDSGGRYRLPLDAKLRSALRHRPPAHAESGAGLTAREVQTLIRAGVSAEEVADRAGWALTKIRVFEAPVLAERGHVAGLAMNTRLRNRADVREGELLSDRVARRLRSRGVSPESTEWDAVRPETGDWQVLVTFPAGGRERQASWGFDHSLGTLEPLDDEARWLFEDDAAAGELPAPPRLGEDSVYDVDAAGGVVEAAGPAPAVSARADQTDALVTAIREHTHAGERRGARRSRARGSGSGSGERRREEAPAAATLTGAEELPLVELPPVEPDAVPPPARGVHPLDQIELHEEEFAGAEFTEAADSSVPEDEAPVEGPGDGSADEPDPAESADVDTVPPGDVEPAAESADPASVDVETADESADPSPESPDPTPAAEPRSSTRRTRRRGRVGVPDWNDVMFGPPKDAPSDG